MTFALPQGVVIIAWGAVGRIARVAGPNAYIRRRQAPDFRFESADQSQPSRLPSLID